MAYLSTIMHTGNNVALSTPNSLVLTTYIHCTFCVCNNNSQNLASKWQVCFRIRANLQNLKFPQKHFFSFAHSIRANILNAVLTSRSVLSFWSSQSKLFHRSKAALCYAFSLITRWNINGYWIIVASTHFAKWLHYGRTAAQQQHGARWQRWSRSDLRKTGYNGQII